jgi:hypothetical protein
MTDRLTDEQIAAIRDGCEDVTPGPWDYVPDHFSDGSIKRRSVCVERSKYDWIDLISDLNNALDAAHIARCDPDTIRAIATELLERRAAEAARQATDDEISADLLQWADSIDADGDDLRPLLRRAAAALIDRLAQIKSAVDGAAKFADRATALSARATTAEAQRDEALAKVARLREALDGAAVSLGSCAKIFRHQGYPATEEETIAAAARARAALGEPT